MRQFIRIIENANLPTWARDASVLSPDDLKRLDSAEFIEDDEWDLEWRLCRVPVALLPDMPADELVMAEPDQMDGIRDWLNADGVEALKGRPLVATWDGRAMTLLDGYHRLAAAREMGAQTIWCSVGLPVR